MDVEEFTRKWGIKRSELALLIDTPLGTMNHWFAEKVERKEPANVRRLLSVWDKLFTRWAEDETDFGTARAIFEALRDRGEGDFFKESH